MNKKKYGIIALVVIVALIATSISLLVFPSKKKSKSGNGMSQKNGDLRLSILLNVKQKRKRKEYLDFLAFMLKKHLETLFIVCLLPLLSVVPLKNCLKKKSRIFNH
jgi:hypothetical protein